MAGRDFKGLPCGAFMQNCSERKGYFLMVSAISRHI